MIDDSNEEFDEGGGRDEVDDESDDGPARPKIMSFAGEIAFGDCIWSNA